MEPNDGFKNKQDDVDETATMSSNDKTVLSSTEMTELVAQASADDDSDSPSQDKPKKKSHAMAIGMVFLAILAIGGIGFGIWAWTTGFSQNKKNEEEITTLRSQLAEATKPAEEEVVVVDDIAKDRISNELAQNLINPYMGTFTYLNDIFDHEFNENTKFYVAFKNLGFDWWTFSKFGDTSKGIRSASMRYDMINEKYKYLFGDNKDLDKTNYQEGYYTFVYDAANDEFIVELLGGGGTMSSLFSVIKEAHYDENGNIVVEVYHDKINVCAIEGADQNYCTKGMGYHTIMDDEMKRIIDNNTNRVPVYNMIFKNDGNHYYLSAINKQ